MTSLYTKNENDVVNQEDDEKEHSHNNHVSTFMPDYDSSCNVLESSSIDARNDRFFSCTGSMEMSETVGSPSLNLNYSKSSSTSSSPVIVKRYNYDDQHNDNHSTVSSPFHTPANDTTTQDNNNSSRMGEGQGMMIMTGQQQQQQNLMETIENMNNNTGIRPRFDSEEYYRALAASHAASNPYGFFNVHNKGNTTTTNNNNSSANGSQHSRNNSGSVLYCDTNSDETGSIFLPQNNRNLSNRDRLSSYDSTGNNSLVILHKKNTNTTTTTTRPPVTHHNTHNPIEASTKVLPYHKRKELAERENSMNDVRPIKDPTLRSNNNGNNKGIEMDNYNNNIDASAIRTNKLTTISSMNFTNANNNLAKQSQQKQESYKRNSLNINTSISNSNNNYYYNNHHHYSPDENASHKRTFSSNTTGSIRFTKGQNNGGNASSDSSSPTKEIQDQNKSTSKIGLPLYPTRGGTGKDMIAHNYYDHVPQQLQHLQPLQTGYHIRADSGGSVSSLGSNTGGAGSFARNTGGSLTDRLGKEINSFIQDSNINHTTDPDKKHQHNMFNLLHGMVESNSPKSGHHSIEDEMAEFHSKNQAFLQKAERERNKRNLVYSDIKSISKTKRYTMSAYIHTYIY